MPDSTLLVAAQNRVRACRHPPRQCASASPPTPPRAPSSSQVNQLLEVQRQLHSVLTGGGLTLPESGKNKGPPPLPWRRAIAQSCIAPPTRAFAYFACAAGAAGAAGPKASATRNLLGRAVRVQAEQQRELDMLRDSLSEAHVAAWSATEKAAAAAAEAAASKDRGDRLQAELTAERNERMESESAALEREEALEAKIAELEEKERRRIELEAALEAAAPPPDMPAPSIAVAQPPPGPPPPAFGAAGGFEL